MDLACGLIAAFTLLLLSAVKGVFIAYPLGLMIGLLLPIYWRRGFSLGQLATFLQRGACRGGPVLRILLLIGALMAVWLAAGTVPALVYYGIQWIHPRFFVASAFLLTGLMSLLLGTSFGTVGTIGLALIIMARSSPVATHWVTGAIIAGAYVGDRCSPLSSSAHLVAQLTQTSIYSNLQRMVGTSLIPLLLTMLGYGLVALVRPLSIEVDPLLLETINHTFVIHPVTLLPAGVLVVLAVLRLPIMWTMGTSFAIALLLATRLQLYSGLDILNFVFKGFQLATEHTLSSLFYGGGLLAMAKVCLVVVLSTALSELLYATHTLIFLEDRFSSSIDEPEHYPGTLGISGLAAACGCTQTIAILLTYQLRQSQYGDSTDGRSDLALDLEDSAVLVSPLIPWNIAGFVPAMMLMGDISFIPYALYLYLLPLYRLLLAQWQKKLNKGKQLMWFSNSFKKTQ